MNNNGAVESFEIERKYEVAEDTSLPEAAVFATVQLQAAETLEHELHASYFDTPDVALASQRLALRHRLGGKDEGWHLKAKGDDGARELLWPSSVEMPAGARAEVAERIGEAAIQRLQNIATLRTNRITTMLFDAAGNAVVEIADDRVESVNELTGRVQRWREWEAELMPDADPALLDQIEPLLIAMGARRVRGTSKIQRTMSAESDAS